jgi:hypothetical protein
MIKSVFEGNEQFDKYTKALSLLRAQKSMSKIARIVPPSQRIISRYMNLLPLFEWGVKMIHLLNKNQLNEDEKTALSFLESLSTFVIDTYLLLNCLSDIQTLLKLKGFNKTSKKEALSIVAHMKSGNALKIKKKLRDYFADLTRKAKGKTICCSSDIIESCFGKYKDVVHGNKSVGISDLSLCIAAMMGINDTEMTNQAMENIKVKQINEWKTNNISKTLFAEKIELNNKIERICGYNI